MTDWNKFLTPYSDRTALRISFLGRGPGRHIRRSHLCVSVYPLCVISATRLSFLCPLRRHLCVPTTLHFSCSYQQHDMDSKSTGFVLRIGIHGSS